MAQQDTLRMIAAVQDRFSGPLRALQRQLRDVGGLPVRNSIGGVSRELHRLGTVAGAVGRTIRTGALVGGLGSIALAGWGVVRALDAVRGSVTGFADRADALRTFGLQIGFSVQQLRVLHATAENFGVSSETVDTSLSQMARRLGALRARQGALYTSLKETNPELLKQLRGAKDTAAAFEIMMGTLAGIPDEAERARVAYMFFSRSGQEMTRLVAEGRGTFSEEWMRQSRLLGEVTAEDAAQADAFGDAVNNLKTSLTGLQDAIGSKLLGPMTEMLNKMSEFIAANREDWATSIVGAVTKVGEALSRYEWQKLFTSMKAWFDSIEWGQITENLKQTAIALNNFADRVGGWKNVLIGLAAITFMPLALSVGALALNLALLTGSLLKLPIGKLRAVQAAAAGTAGAAGTRAGGAAAEAKVRRMPGAKPGEAVEAARPGLGARLGSLAGKTVRGFAIPTAALLAGQFALDKAFEKLPKPRTPEGYDPDARLDESTAARFGHVIESLGPILSNLAERAGKNPAMRRAALPGWADRELGINTAIAAEDAREALRQIWSFVRPITAVFTDLGKRVPQMLWTPLFGSAHDAGEKAAEDFGRAFQEKLENLPYPALGDPGAFGFGASLGGGRMGGGMPGIIQASLGPGGALARYQPDARLRSMGGAANDNAGTGGTYSNQGTGGRANSWMNFMLNEAGLSKEKAAAVVAGLMGESGPGLDPTAVGDGGTSIGTAQWHDERATALQQFAAAQGKSWKDVRVQQEFWLHEMRTSHADAWRAVKESESGYAALDAYVRKFEVPANPGGEVRKRSAFMQQLLAGDVAPGRGSMVDAGRAAVRYANQGAIRDDPITPELMDKLQRGIAAVYGPGYSGEVYSGGQDEKGHGHQRTGSTRHDKGMAADVYVYGPDGKRISGDALAPLAQHWLATKQGSVGLEMRGGGIHLDQHTQRAPTWTYGELTAAQRDAVQAGLAGTPPAYRGTDGSDRISAIQAQRMEQMEALRALRPKIPQAPVDAPQTNILKAAMRAGLVGGQPQRIEGDASVNIQLGGFPKGTKASGDTSGIFKRYRLDRGRSMPAMSTDEEAAA